MVGPPITVVPPTSLCLPARGAVAEGGEGAADNVPQVGERWGNALEMGAAQSAPGTGRGVQEAHFVAGTPVLARRAEPDDVDDAEGFIRAMAVAGNFADQNADHGGVG